MKFKIHYRYEIEEIPHEGDYITDNPQEFINPMRQAYGDKITFHIQGASE